VNATRISTYAGTAAPRSGSKRIGRRALPYTFSAWRSFHGRSPASSGFHARAPLGTSRAASYSETLKLAPTILVVTLAMAQSPPEGWRTYQDPRSQFQFVYPEGFGRPSPGTDDGFGDRAAAIRFSEFSAGVHARRIILGGEAVLTTGPPQVDLQAAGGLYDAITLQVFPAPIAAAIRNALPVLTAVNFCDAIGREQHLAPADERLSKLTAKQREAIATVDRMGNVTPKALRCEILADTVTFDKESARDPAGPSRHTYGAIRFLSRPYSSFQLVRGSSEAPSTSLLQQITTVVNSWKEK
jgi:hypothetical protein